MPAMHPRRRKHAHFRSAHPVIQAPRIIMPTLDQLNPGDRASIASLSGDSALVQRLLELGVFDGQDVEVIAVAPLGDPIEIRCGDSRLSLRRREANSIQVHLSPRP